MVAIAILKLPCRILVILLLLRLDVLYNFWLLCVFEYHYKRLSHQSIIVHNADAYHRRELV